MGNVWSSEEPRPQLVLVPPLFERHLRGRNRMSKSSYDVLFSKLQRRRLFEDYFAEQHQFLGRVMLQPPEDQHVDIITEVGTPYYTKRGDQMGAKTVFRWQRDEFDPNTFADLRFSTDPFKRARARVCAFDARSGLGVFAILPLLSRSKLGPQLGLRFGSPHYSLGVMADPGDFNRNPTCAWFIARVAQLTAGVQYRPDPLRSLSSGGGHARMSSEASDLSSLAGSDVGDGAPDVDSWLHGLTEQLLAARASDWSFALSYGSPFRRGPLDPVFEAGVEVVQGNKLISSYYHHLVVQRKVKNPFENSDVVGITNYIDVGFEITQSLAADVDGDKDEGMGQLLDVQLAGSWQVNKNVLVKAKLGSHALGIVAAFKSWWQPSVAFAVTVRQQYNQKSPVFGAVLSMENFGGVTYERAQKNYRMMTPSKQHAANEAFTDEGARKTMEEGPVGSYESSQRGRAKKVHVL